jgi:hypothetical protein
MPPSEAPLRELVVVVKPDVRLRAAVSGITSLGGADVAPLRRALAAAGARMQPLFDASEDRLERAARDATSAAAGLALSRYYRVLAPDAALDALAAQLGRSPLVEAAYVKPVPRPAGLNDMQPKAQEAPSVTPAFDARQGYLDAAPAGVGARFAWTVPGGRGAGIRIIDIEGGWNFAHEDLLQNQGGVVAGTPLSGIDFVNHGTAAIGVFSGDGIGVTGICRDANVSAIAATGALGTAAAIHSAADRLGAGDIILVELELAGPRFDPATGSGNIALEWWPDNFDAIRYATNKGVIVIEVAGNGSENLDDPAYDTPMAGFPAGWSNPFRRGARDCGAILVGAGAPPPGTHGSVWGPDRSRLDFSNYGAAVDVQAWGREVTTTGYGDLQGGSNPNLWYTDRYAGTSGAAAIVAGVVGSVQGVRRAQGVPPLSPAQARALLRTTGSPQQDAAPFPATQRIGNRPDLRQMLDALGIETDPPVGLHRYWGPQIPDHFYTTNWSELGAGNAVWIYEGVACRVHPQQAPGTVPLFRYWNSRAGDHFYTTDFSELGGGQFDWIFEGIACYVHAQQAPGTVPLYRYWNTGGSEHFYTTDWNELGSGQGGWLFEKVQCYVHP